MQTCHVRLGMLVLSLAFSACAGCANSRDGCRSGSCRKASADFSERRSGSSQPRVVDNVPRRNTQQNCPVTGEKLGSMGPPIPVSLKGTTIQVCCEGCVAAVRNDPAKSLKIVDDERALAEFPAVREVGAGMSVASGSNVRKSASRCH
jgi:hypothetical protein